MATIIHFLLIALVPYYLVTSSHFSSKHTYIIHMDVSATAASMPKQDHYTAILQSLPTNPIIAGDDHLETKEPPELLYVYDAAISGFAARLTEKQVAALREVGGFLSAVQDEILLELHTTHSPQFMGLTPGKGLWSAPEVASEVVIGVVDTGIWPEHVSFRGDGGRAPSEWKGVCEEGPGFSSASCNGKLVGARSFYKGYESIAGIINETEDYRSPRDSNGHGTHTASTAAGAVVCGASLFGLARGCASGTSPAARLAAYKACWPFGCASSDILAAVDAAVADGVHVLSLSLGGGARPFHSDPLAKAAFGAVEKGVVVSFSAGNAGPAAFTVGNVAPWVMTVGGGYMDRGFPTAVETGDGRRYFGASLYRGRGTGVLGLVHGEKAGGGEGAKVCAEGSLSPEMVKGKIVVCELGRIGRTHKGKVAKLAGAAGMLLLNRPEQGEELFADAHILPASSLGAAASASLRVYLSSAANPTAKLAFLGTRYASPAPAVAAFSSRGPSSVSPDVLKPDVIAPGMSILAAWPPSVSPSLLASDRRRVRFNIISGTSMSCPHAAGLAALLRATRPRWSPAAIKSAIMTTASTTSNNGTGIIDVATSAPADAFVMGSGHIDPTRAANPGLVYDMGTDDYVGYLCSLNYTPVQMAALTGRSTQVCKKRGRKQWNLNYPSFSVVFGRGNETVVYRRRVTNVGEGRCRYRVEVKEPRGVRVVVVPKVLRFKKVGERRSFEVRFVGSGGGDGEFGFGEMVWACCGYSVRSPIAVTWVGKRGN